MKRESSRSPIKRTDFTGKRLEWILFKFSRLSGSIPSSFASAVMKDYRSDSQRYSLQCTMHECRLGLSRRHLGNLSGIPL